MSDRNSLTGLHSQLQTVWERLLRLRIADCGLRIWLIGRIGRIGLILAVAGGELRIDGRLDEHGEGAGSGIKWN